jgi:hypothetical protein
MEGTIHSKGQELVESIQDSGKELSWETGYEGSVG